jgi:hypothetical protein
MKKNFFPFLIFFIFLCLTLSVIKPQRSYGWSCMQCKCASGNTCDFQSQGESGSGITQIGSGLGYDFNDACEIGKEYNISDCQINNQCTTNENCFDPLTHTDVCSVDRCPDYSECAAVPGACEEGARCHIRDFSAAYTQRECFGVWDRGNMACVKCDPDPNKHVQVNVYGTSGAINNCCFDDQEYGDICNNPGNYYCEQACGADPECDELAQDGPGQVVPGGICNDCHFTETNDCSWQKDACGIAPCTPLEMHQTCGPVGCTAGVCIEGSTQCANDPVCVGGGSGTCPCPGKTACSSTGFEGGLVPCGRICDDPNTTDINECCPCTFCHIFVLLDRIVDFLLLKIVPPLAVLMIVIAGVMFIVAYFGGTEILTGGVKGGPALFSQAKKLMSAVITGLIIIYGAWLIVNTVLLFLGVNDWVWPNSGCSGPGPCSTYSTQATCLANQAEACAWHPGGWFEINCPVQ